MEFLILFSPQSYYCLWRCPVTVWMPWRGGGYWLEEERGRCNTTITLYYTLIWQRVITVWMMKHQSSKEGSHSGLWLRTRRRLRLAKRTEKRALEAPAMAPLPPDMMTTGGLIVPLSSVRMMSSWGLTVVLVRNGGHLGSKTSSSSSSSSSYPPLPSLSSSSLSISFLIFPPDPDPSLTSQSSSS